MTVSAAQRHSKRQPCKICGGGENDTRGIEKRCMGFISEDGDWEHCSREEKAFGIQIDGAGTYAHKMHGDCRCGVQHGPPKSDVAPTPLTEYNYFTADGELLFQVVRKLKDGKKSFLQRRPDGAGDWIWSTKDLKMIPYRLPELLASTDTVYILEGEKDVETARKLGLTATCNPRGAGKWKYVQDTASIALTGRDVVVVGDNDEAGREHAADVESRLRNVAKSVRRVFPPEPWKDLSDWVAGPEQVTADTVRKLGKPQVVSHVQILTGKQIGGDLPPLDYLCKGIGMIAGGAAPDLWGGYGFSGKTMALQGMALAIASQEALLWGAHPVKHGRVLHVDMEQGERLTRIRYQRLARGMGLDLDELDERLALAVMPRIKLTAADERHWEDIMAERDLIVIDSFRAATPGQDENDSQVRDALDMLGGISNKTKCRPAVILHARKPTQDEDAMSSHMIRGSGALYDAADGAWILGAEKGQPTRVEHVKARSHGEPVEPFALKITDVAWEGDAKWGLIVKAYGAEITQTVDNAKLKLRNEEMETGARTLLELVARHPGSSTRELYALGYAQGLGRMKIQAILAWPSVAEHLTVVLEKRGGKTPAQTFFINENAEKFK